MTFLLILLVIRLFIAIADTLLKRPKIELDQEDEITAVKKVIHPAEYLLRE